MGRLAHPRIATQELPTRDRAVTNLDCEPMNTDTTSHNQPEALRQDRHRQAAHPADVLLMTHTVDGREPPAAGASPMVGAARAEWGRGAELNT